MPATVPEASQRSGADKEKEATEKEGGRKKETTAQVLRVDRNGGSGARGDHLVDPVPIREAAPPH